MEDVWSLLRKHTHTMARMKMPEDENCCEMSCTFRDLSSREDFSSLSLSSPPQFNDAICVSFYNACINFILYTLYDAPITT